MAEDRRLINVPETNRDNDATLIKIRKINHIKYGTATSVVFLDLFHSESQEYRTTKSFHNVQQCKQGTLIADNLVKGGIEPKTITILTPYIGQYRQYQLCLQKYREANPNLASNIKLHLIDLNCVTVDAFQGFENEVIILDMVITERLGFLQKASRLGVALSRAPLCLYIIGNKG